MRGDEAQNIDRARRLADSASATIVSPAALDALNAEWRDLADDAAEPNAFYAPAMLAPALVAFSNERPEIVTVRDGAGRLIGLAPVAPLRGYSRLPVPYVATWMHKHCFFAAPLVRAGAEHAFFRAFFDFTERRGVFLRLRHLDAEGPLFAAAAAVAAESGRFIAPSARYERAMLRAPWATDDYLAQSMRGKHRKDLRRRRARLEEAGTVSFERFAEGGDLDAWTEEFLTIEGSGWKGAAGTALKQDAPSSQFFRGAVGRAHAEGALQFFRFRLDGRTLGSAVNFQAGSVSFAFKIAYDEAFARYSPGVMILIDIMRALEREGGVDLIDSCAKAEHPMIDRLWRERRTISALNISRRDVASRALFRLLMMLEAAGERARARPAETDGDDDL